MSNFRLDGRALTDTEYLRFMRYLEQEAYDDATDGLPTHVPPHATLSVLPPATPPSLHRLADIAREALATPVTGVDEPSDAKTRPVQAGDYEELRAPWLMYARECCD